MVDCGESAALCFGCAQAVLAKVDIPAGSLRRRSASQAGITKTPPAGNRCVTAFCRRIAGLRNTIKKSYLRGLHSCSSSSLSERSRLPVLYRLPLWRSPHNRQQEDPRADKADSCPAKFDRSATLYRSRAAMESTASHAGPAMEQTSAAVIWAAPTCSAPSFR